MADSGGESRIAELVGRWREDQGMEDYAKLEDQAFRVTPRISDWSYYWLGVIAGEVGGSATGTAGELLEAAIDEARERLGLGSTEDHWPRFNTFRRERVNAIRRAKGLPEIYVDETGVEVHPSPVKEA